MEGFNWKAAPLGHIFKSEGHMNLLFKKSFYFPHLNGTGSFVDTWKSFPAQFQCAIYMRMRRTWLSQRLDTANASMDRHCPDEHLDPIKYLWQWWVESCNTLGPITYEAEDGVVFSMNCQTVHISEGREAPDPQGNTVHWWVGKGKPLAVEGINLPSKDRECLQW